MKNIAILFSGNGTDMQAIIDGVKNNIIDGKIVLAICSNNHAYGIERAKKANIPVEICCKKDFASGEQRDEKIKQLLLSYKAELVVLAGYLGILSESVVNAFPRAIINIHPSLLPKHGGKGMYGLAVHQSVIQSGDKITGVTVHYSDANVDTGEIIAQRTAPVLDDDTPESLQARLLTEVEHPLLTEVVAALCKD